MLFDTANILLGGPPVAEVRVVTREEMIEEIKSILEDEHMTIEQFVAEGEADTLTDGFHRDLWLDYRGWIEDT